MHYLDGTTLILKRSAHTSQAVELADPTVFILLGDNLEMNNGITRRKQLCNFRTHAGKKQTNAQSDCFAWISVGEETHGDDVILPETQFIVVVTLKVQQSLGPSPPVPRHHQEVFVVSLVALHGVVWSQVLEGQVRSKLIQRSRI